MLSDIVCVCVCARVQLPIFIYNIMRARPQSHHDFGCQIAKFAHTCASRDRSACLVRLLRLSSALPLPLCLSQLGTAFCIASFLRGYKSASQTVYHKMCLAVLRHKIETEKAKIRMEHEHTNTLKCTSADERTRRNEPIYKTKSSTERISVIKKHTQTQTKNGSGQNLKLMIYVHDAVAVAVCVCMCALFPVQQNISFSTESSIKMLFLLLRLMVLCARRDCRKRSHVQVYTNFAPVRKRVRKVTCRTCEHSKLISRNRGETETNTAICLFARSTH